MRSSSSKCAALYRVHHRSHGRYRGERDARRHGRAVGRPGHCGTQTQVSDSTGNYRFERLLPGTYHLKFSIQGFKTVERRDIIVSASFTATVNVQMDVGNLEETVTVTGASPTVDVKSNLQQTVMNQEILEGVPTGRDPWSLAKIIPGVQVATYDVGGNQAMQQSALRVHGARDDDKNFAIDGIDGQLAGGRRRGDDALLRPGDVRSDHLPDVGDSGGGPDRRHLPEHGDEERRQPLARRHEVLLRRQGLAERQRR